MVADVDEALPCDDCGVDTSPTTGIGEHYMVLDEVWLEAGMTEPAADSPPTGPMENLCIGCLERRLGRRLVPTDFLDPPLSRDPDRWLYAGASPRLLDRRGL